MKKILVFAAIAVVVVAVPLLSKLGGGQDAKQVELAEAEYRLIKSSILASGTLAFREQIELTPEVIGQVVGAARHDQTPWHLRTAGVRARVGRPPLAPDRHRARAT